jgi:hypothetical protein
MKTKRSHADVYAYMYDADISNVDSKVRGMICRDRKHRFHELM